jgi:hypothetical protein
MENITYVQCPTCPLKRRIDRPQCKACHETHLPLHPPGAPKKGPKPVNAKFDVAVLHPLPPGAPKKGPKPVNANLPPPIPIDAAILEEIAKVCKYGIKCTLYGCTKPHPEGYVEPVDPASKPCKFGTACTNYGCKKQHPEDRVEPVDPATKPCPCETKFGFCNVKLNPNCLHPHKVSRMH